jgi:hypothetical protein
MASLAARLLRSRKAWAVACAVALAWAILVQVGVHLRGRGNLRHLDPGAPYRIELGRGSGLYGLNTVQILHDRTVTLHRRGREHGGQTLPEEFVETATIHLSVEDLTEVLDAVEDTGVLSLYKEYHEPGVADGTQWVLWVQQGQRETSVYCDNYFPKSMVRFADALDRILARNGIEHANWRRVDDDEALSYDRALWDSIRQ